MWEVNRRPGGYEARCFRLAMPHLLIERIRSAPALCQCCGRSKDGKLLPLSKTDATCAYVIEAIDIISGLIILIGSACFLPSFSTNRDIFVMGCVLFVLGTTGYLGISIFALAEALYVKGVDSLEACENSLYVAGAILFNAGTVLYWPEESDWPATLAARELAPGQFFNWFSPEFEGTVLFIIGSLFFAMASYVNGLSQRGFDTAIQKMLTASTTCYMVGALLFVMGSVAWLPELGCGGRMEEFGAIMYVIGSLFYLIGSVISVIRLTLQLEDPEYSPLIQHLSPKIQHLSPKLPIAQP